MTSSLTAVAPWLWVPVVLFAALAQTVRNTAQRSLTAELGTLPATLVRFLYGLPFAGVWLALLYAWPAQPPAVPHFSAAYLGWIALGAFFQIAGTAFLLLRAVVAKDHGPFEIAERRISVDAAVEARMSQADTIHPPPDALAAEMEGGRGTLIRQALAHLGLLR